MACPLQYSFSKYPVENETDTLTDKLLVCGKRKIGTPFSFSSSPCSTELDENEGESFIGERRYCVKLQKFDSVCSFNTKDQLETTMDVEFSTE